MKFLAIAGATVLILGCAEEAPQSQRQSAPAFDPTPKVTVDPAVAALAERDDPDLTTTMSAQEIRSALAAMSVPQDQTMSQTQGYDFARPSEWASIESESRLAAPETRKAQPAHDRLVYVAPGMYHYDPHCYLLGSGPERERMKLSDAVNRFGKRPCSRCVR